MSKGARASARTRIPAFRPAAGFVAMLLLALAAWSSAQEPKSDIYGTSNCMGCHGQSAMGGLGPPIAKTKIDKALFLKTVRDGKGMMPPTPASQMSDADVEAVFAEVKAKPWLAAQIPIAFKVGQMLTTQNLGRIFMVVFGLSFLMGLGVLVKTLKAGGFGALWPYLGKLGYGKAAAIALRSLIVDGLGVASLYRKDKFRWAMHGLMLYGFCGLILADILLQVFNPMRSKLPFDHALKLLPMLSGIAVMTGVFYAMYRYKKDEYIDNGLTLGRDFAFINLLLHTVISGFLTVVINRTNAHTYVMPIYLYHLVSLSMLVLTAPFTRFQHAFLVPALVATTRLSDAVAKAGVDVGFRREPSPGRHHKSERIVADLLEQLGPEYEGGFRLRYYP